jgi:hypothetical protein
MIILWSVRPRLHFVLRIRWVIPTLILNPPPPHPSDMQLPAAVVQPVDVRVTPYPCDILAKVRVLVFFFGPGIEKEMIVSEPSFPVTDGKKESSRIVYWKKSRVRHILEGSVRSRVPW